MYPFTESTADETRPGKRYLLNVFETIMASVAENTFVEEPPANVAYPEVIGPVVNSEDSPKLVVLKLMLLCPCLTGFVVFKITSLICRPLEETDVVETLSRPI